MKLMRCPVNGLRPIQEFAFGGTTRPSPDPSASTDREWADYVFCRSGEPGLKKEWWYHIASGTWFIAERDTLTDEIVRPTYLMARNRWALLRGLWMMLTIDTGPSLPSRAERAEELRWLEG